MFSLASGDIKYRSTNLTSSQVSEINLFIYFSLENIYDNDLAWIYEISPHITSFWFFFAILSGFDNIRFSKYVFGPMSGPSNVI